MLKDMLTDGFVYAQTGLAVALFVGVSMVGLVFLGSILYYVIF